MAPRTWDTRVQAQFEACSSQLDRSRVHPRLSEMRISAPDELAGFLLQERLKRLGRAELVRNEEGGWDVHVPASGPQTLAAVLELTREWLEKERIPAALIEAEGQVQTLTRP